MHPIFHSLSPEDLGFSEKEKTDNHLQIILDQLKTQEDLYHLLGQYVAFNAPFGAGVASLSGAVAHHRELFKDPTDPLSALSDRSGEVAQHIFVAAVDEFGGADAQYPSHRQLAQDFLKGISRHFAQSPETFNALIAPTNQTQDAVAAVQSGYGLTKRMNEQELLEGIGFHVGSEHLAGEEFRTIDAYLRANHGDMVASLERVDPAVAAVDPYAWIRIHTTVEDEHAAHAVRAADLALRYYKGAHSWEDAKSLILQGIQNFAAVQSDFFKKIAL